MAKACNYLHMLEAFSIDLFIRQWDVLDMDVKRAHASSWMLSLVLSVLITSFNKVTFLLSLLLLCNKVLTFLFCFKTLDFTALNSSFNFFLGDSLHIWVSPHTWSWSTFLFNSRRSFTCERCGKIVGTDPSRTRTQLREVQSNLLLESGQSRVYYT